ncbi:MAG TPA: DUF2520 domain-containing protein [Burkholderiales bacterium]|nr:DUF2520 domain-containing protein [Burkholderiales bacterium]
MRLGFVGAGRVGKGLSLALSRAGYTITGVASRSRGDAQKVVDASDIVFLTVPDDAIAAACRSLTWKKQGVVHCSGAAELTVLEAASGPVGGFHPLVMFADPEIAARSIAGAAIAVEADEPLLSRLKSMVDALGARLLVIPPGARAAYHGGAHFAAAFVCALLAEGVEIYKRIGIAPEDALTALLGLLRGATDAVAHSGPSKAMAGSIARGDIDTVRRHLAALDALDVRFGEIYRTLALKTVPLALAAGGMTPARAEEIRKLLASR